MSHHRESVRPRIKVYCDTDVTRGEPRAYISSGGVCDGSGDVVDGVPYRSPSIVPAGEWRAPTEDEARDLFASPGEEMRPGLTVSVLVMPEDVMKPLDRLGLARIACVEEGEQILRTGAYGAAVEEAVAGLWPYVERLEGLRLLGTSVQRGGLRTTSTNHDESGALTYSGLHIDTWDDLSTDRDLCSRQMCINLGAEDRFFVFVNRPVDDLITSVEGAVSWPDYVRLGIEFTRRFPSHPVIKVRVRPGEAYIAPTENMIHDGSTIGTTSADVTLNLRGHFHSRVDDAH